MCNFCILFDFSSAMARVENGIATIVKAPTDIPFLPRQQFNFCPVCGSPREATVSSQTFGQNLRRIRRMRGVTQTALANAIGVQKACISKYEKGRSSPSIRRVSQICRALDISPQELV